MSKNKDCPRCNKSQEKILSQIGDDSLFEYKGQGKFYDWVVYLLICFLVILPPVWVVIWILLYKAMFKNNKNEDKHESNAQRSAASDDTDK